MKWDVDIVFDISRGRKRIFSLHNLIPWFRNLHRKHRDRAHSCYAKTRFPHESAAMNAAWFKKHPKPHRAYLCDLCDGWHITTHI